MRCSTREGPPATRPLASPPLHKRVVALETGVTLNHLEASFSSSESHIRHEHFKFR